MYVLGEKSPFTGYNFYQWAKEYCNIKEKHVGHSYPIKDYSDCFFNIDTLNFLSFTQKEAGFKNEIREYFINIEMKPITKIIIDTIRKNKFFEGKSDIIVADGGAKEMSKVHQLSGGTVILESGKTAFIDDTKAVFIADNFATDNKLAIFYKFKGELELLRKHLDITEDIDEFNNSQKHIALQFVSGREGIKLNNADIIVAYNIDFSATTYFQFRDRMTTIDSVVSDIYWLFSDVGIERQVYNVVKNKKNFTLQYYDRTTVSIENNKEIRSRGMVLPQTNKDEQKRNTGHSGFKKRRNTHVHRMQNVKR